LIQNRLQRFHTIIMGRFTYVVNNAPVILSQRTGYGRFPPPLPKDLISSLPQRLSRYIMG
jgi:hypothetical protein